MRCFAVVLAVLFAASSADAECGAYIVTAKVLDGDEGGVIVYHHASPTRGTPYTLDVIQKQWRWKLQDDRIVEPLAEILAPGLVVYTLPPRIRSGILLDGSKVIAEREITDAAPLRAPKVTSVMRGATDTVVNIVGAAPRAAVAIVLTDDRGDALSFGVIQRGRPLVVHRAEACAPQPKGSREPRAGMKVRAFYVDRYGQASNLSIAKRILAER